jgi:hypothetical protein
MDDGAREKVLEQLNSIWGRAFQEERFHDALAIAFANYLITRETRSEELKQSFLIAMRGGVIEELLPPAICDGCVTMLSSEAFATPT